MPAVGPLWYVPGSNTQSGLRCSLPSCWESWWLMAPSRAPSGNGPQVTPQPPVTGQHGVQRQHGVPKGPSFPQMDPSAGLLQLQNFWRGWCPTLAPPPASPASPTPWQLLPPVHLPNLPAPQGACFTKNLPNHNLAIHSFIHSHSTDMY